MGSALLGAAGQAWPPFVLVAGLLMIGEAAEADGIFAALGARAERLPGGSVALLCVLLALEAVVTAVLNLDTAAVFVTPILLHAARERGADDRAFLYGALFIANGASLLLPGSNLTNLIVLAHEHTSGLEFARHMALPWLAVVALTVAFVAVVFPPRAQGREDVVLPPLRLGVGAAATAAATVLMLVLSNAALPVLAVGIAAVALRRIRPALDAPVLAGLFAVAVLLGTLGREWGWPRSFLAGLDGPATAAVAAAASVLVNNLPASALLAAHRPPHPLQLLLGLNLGPNLAFTGSLSAYLWYRSARRAGAAPSLATSSLLGVVLVPLTLAASLGALALWP